MSYLLLLVVLVILALVFYLAFKRDLLSPTVLSGLAFIFCTILAIFGLGTWNNVKELSMLTLAVVGFGYAAFGAGELLVRKILHIKNNDGYKVKTINVDKWKIIAAVLIGVITGALLIAEIYRICNHYSYSPSNLPQAISFYRTKIGLFSTDLRVDGTDINFIVKQLKKACDVICVIFMFILVNNIASKDKKKNCVILAIPIAIFMALTLLTSGRSLLMHICASALIIAAIIYREKNCGAKKTNRRLIAVGASATAVLLILFYSVLPLVGRRTSHSFSEYMSFYLGTSLPSFNQYLNTEHPDTAIGEETFSGVYYTLDKVGIIKNEKIGSREWTHFDRGYESNVYMSFRRYYNDFGFAGVIVLQMIAGVGVSVLYLMSIKKYKMGKYLLSIIYAFYFYTVIDQIRDEQFYGLLSSATLAHLALMIVCYVIFVDDSVLAHVSRRICGRS